MGLLNKRASSTYDDSDMQTDYVVGQDNIQGSMGPIGFDIHNRVFVLSALASLIFIVLTLMFPAQAGELFQSIVGFSTRTLDGYFMILVDFFIVFCLALIVLPHGKVRLGGPDARPEHSYLSWFALLFTAGIGIALLFFSVLEPVYHANVSSPLGTPSPFGADGALNMAAVDEASAMGLAGTFLHWGLHGWAVYAVMALALAIFSYNKKLPFSIRSIFFPILGDRVWGWWGHWIDILAGVFHLVRLRPRHWAWRAAGQRGTEFCFRYGHQYHDTGHHHCTCHCGGAGIGVARPGRGRKATLRDQHDRGRDVLLLCAVRWPDPDGDQRHVDGNDPLCDGANSASRRPLAVKMTLIVKTGRCFTGRGGSAGRLLSACLSRACPRVVRCVNFCSAC